MLPVETATDELLDLLDPQARAPLLLSGARAAALSLANERDAADPARPVLVERAAWLDAAAALALADPGQDLARAPIGPLQADSAWSTRRLARAALDLAQGGGAAARAVAARRGASRRSVITADDLAGLAADVRWSRARKLPLEDMPRDPDRRLPQPRRRRSMSRW